MVALGPAINPLPMGRTQPLTQGARFGPTAPTDEAGSGRAKKTGFLADQANRESLRALVPLRKKNAATVRPAPAPPHPA